MSPDAEVYNTTVSYVTYLYPAGDITVSGVI